MTDSLPAHWLARLHAHEAAAVLLGRDYQVLATNPAYVERVGRGAVGRRCYEVSHHYDAPCDQRGESCPLATCLKTGRSSRVLHIHHTPRGPEHVDVRLEPVRGGEGTIEAFVEVLGEVTAVSTRAGDADMVGQAPAFNEAVALLHRAAPSEIPVLLTGPSGTGKEVAALALHRASLRASGPFVPVACSGLPDSLFESELFGHERGAFTGASQRRVGLVESAQGGTLFLDEIGDVPPSMQVRLLRLLESRSFRRVGSSTSIEADFRLVCATHRDLDAMVVDGTFREDLFYRINAFPIRMPPLSERLEDLPLLAQHFLGAEVELTQGALSRLREHRFPGNLRELRNLLQRAALLADGGAIRPEHLPPSLGPSTATIDSRQLPWMADGSADVVSLEEAEARYLRWARRQHDGDRSALARRLGVSERTLYRKLRSLDHGAE